MSKLDQQIRRRVEQFVDELTELVKEEALKSVADALEAGGLTATPQRGARTTPQRAARTAQRRGTAPARDRGKGQKRSPAELESLTSALLKEIKREPGRRIEEIASEMGTTTKELALPVRKLVKDKKIKTRGQKRATTYYGK